MAACCRISVRPASQPSFMHGTLGLRAAGTSGSTTPGCGETPGHAPFRCSGTTLAQTTGEADTDRILLTMSLSSTFGFFGACTILRAGKTACFAPIGAPSLVLIGTYGIDAISGSPQQVIALLDLVEKGGRFQLDSLRQIRVGGGSLSKTFARRVQTSLCRKLFASYGITELGKVAGANYDVLAHVP